MENSYSRPICYNYYIKDDLISKCAIRISFETTARREFENVKSFKYTKIQ